MKRRERLARMRDTVDAKAAVDAALRAYGLTSAIEGERALALWATVVGPQVAARTQADSLHDGVLRVLVVGSAWIQELSLMRGQLLERYRQALGDSCAVRELQFRLGPVQQARSNGANRSRKAASPSATTSNDEIDTEADRVIDPELREIIRRVRRKHRR